MPTPVTPPPIPVAPVGPVAPLIIRGQGQALTQILDILRGAKKILDYFRLVSKIISIGLRW
jgi:hypothetical protein